MLPIVFVVGSCVLRPGFWKPIADEIAQSGKGYRAIGTWARDYFSPGSVVGSMQSGGLSYYAPRIKVLNLDGVVNREACLALKERSLEKYMNIQGMEYELGWTQNTK